MIIVPVVLALATGTLSYVQATVAGDNENRRASAAALQTYLDRMENLVLERKLRENPPAEVRADAVARTLTVLRQIDGEKKGVVLRFLYESHLVMHPLVVNDPIVSLKTADLRDARLSGAKLEFVHLGEASLREADLRGADLRGANLENADLSGANLAGANLSPFHTTVTIYTAKLMGADFRGANLQQADLTDAELERVQWGHTTCPDGTLSDRNPGATCEGH